MKVDLPPADLYVSSMVAHHLSEEQLKILVTTLKDKLSPGKALLTAIYTKVHLVQIVLVTGSAWCHNDNIHTTKDKKKKKKHACNLMLFATKIRLYRICVKSTCFVWNHTC